MPTGPAVCDRCGQLPQGPTTAWSSSATPDGPRWLCGACTRDHLRSIEARLDERWWEPPGRS